MSAATMPSSSTMKIRVLGMIGLSFPVLGFVESETELHSRAAAHGRHALELLGQNADQPQAEGGRFPPIEVGRVTHAIVTHDEFEGGFVQLEAEVDGAGAVAGEGVLERVGDEFVED